MGEHTIDEDLIVMAIQQVVEQLTIMEASMGEEAHKEWVQSAHRARGSSAFMGFVEVAKGFHDAEFHAGTLEARTECIQNLRRSLTKLEVRLRELGFDIPPPNNPTHPPA